MIIKRTISRLLSPLLLLLYLSLSFTFTACGEVEEAGTYDNWQARNETYIDSIASLVGNRYIATEEDIDAMEVGDIFAILDNQSSTNESEAYVYCRKLVSNPEGRRPLYTESVEVFYYATIITGESITSLRNFIGYDATEQYFDEEKEPTPFDSPSVLKVNDNDYVSPYLPTGWTAAIQFMKTGERWMVYMPYQSAGSDNNPLEHSALVFDIILNDVVEE